MTTFKIAHNFPRFLNVDFAIVKRKVPCIKFLKKSNDNYLVSWTYPYENIDIDISKQQPLFLKDLIFFLACLSFESLSNQGDVNRLWLSLNCKTLDKWNVYWLIREKDEQSKAVWPCIPYLGQQGMQWLLRKGIKKYFP